MKLGITEQEKELAREISESKNPGRADIGLIDPADSPPEWSEHNKHFSARQSRAIADLADRTSIRRAADHLNLARSTVEYHKRRWREGGHTKSTPTRIDDRLCGAIRAACHRGDTQEEVANRFSVSEASVSNHAKGKCSHEISVRVPVVEFQHGGYRER